MENLFEYLISKENKKKVISKISMSTLQTGDIVHFRDRDWMIAVSYEDFKTTNFNNEETLKDVAKEDGMVLFHSWGIGNLKTDYAAPRLYNDDFTHKENNAIDIIEVYKTRGKIDMTMSIDKYSLSNLRRMAKEIAKPIKVN